MAEEMTRVEMARLLDASPTSPMRRTYDAAIAGLCANPSSLRPHEIVDLALDVCLADMRASQSPTPA